MDLFTFTVVLIYLLATGYLGYQGYRQTKTAADYLVAGRSAHPVIMALSYGATFISTSAIVGFGGVAANFGMGLLWLTFMNIFVGIFIAFVVIGNPARHMGHHLDAHTFPELLGKRYNSKFIHVLSALVIFCFMPLYATAVIIGGAEFIGPIFHVSYETALYIFSLIVAAYVIAGGLKGVMLTDALPRPTRRCPTSAARCPSSSARSVTRAGPRCPSSAGPRPARRCRRRFNITCGGSW